MADDLAVWLKVTERDRDLMVSRLVKEETETKGDDLPDHGSAGRTRDAESRRSEITEDQDRIQNDVDDRAETLGVHGIDRFSGGL